jgi:bifunctional UDP-N-acetylglucosamine pyrophosphorylase/glucosamine-1-phosphate N-acetyltransferase
MKLHVVILAAGHGKRMRSSTIKVLHTIGGIPMLEHVILTAKKLHPYQIHVIYGQHSSHLLDIFSRLHVHWICQQKQLGTGHAVLQVLPFCDTEDRVLVLFGDTPLIPYTLLDKLLTQTPSNELGLITAISDDPTGLGRIIRNNMGQITRIVEEKDTSASEKKIKEINTGMLTAPAALLKQWLPDLKNNNAQREYYITDIIATAAEQGYGVSSVLTHCTKTVQGVNSKWDLAQLERHYQHVLAKQLALSGVTIIDPHRLDIRSQHVDISEDVTLDVNVILAGKIKIDAHSMIGAHVILKNVKIGKNVIIHPHTVIENSSIDDDTEVGPFARIRPGSVLDRQVKVGNFVEIKNTHIKSYSKANHLTYLGDAYIGEHVNIGAGTITCNYDGAGKHPTTIKDNAFIGANATLVAPLTIGENATIAAGSTIARDAIAQHLTIARVRQKTVTDWQRPEKPATKDG